MSLWGKSAEPPLDSLEGRVPVPAEHCLVEHRVERGQPVGTGVIVESIGGSGHRKRAEQEGGEGEEVHAGCV